MNNREVIEQVERGYRMAQPSTILYPESKSLPSEVKIAQANVYKVSNDGFTTIVSFKDFINVLKLTKHGVPKGVNLQKKIAWV